MCFIQESGDKQPGSVQEVGWKNQAGRDIAELRGRKGSLHPRQPRLPSGTLPWREEAEPRQSSPGTVVRPRYRCDA